MKVLIACEESQEVCNAFRYLFSVLPPPTEEIEPWEFGEPYTKHTLLWLKGLPPLMPTLLCYDTRPYIPSDTSRKIGGASYGVARTKKDRSRTFHGIAVAMAEQWGGVCDG